MALNPQISTKRIAISKANGQMVIVVAVAAFITVFCLVASNAVFNQNKYQARVVSAKEDAHDQLRKNIKSFDSLRSSYNKFNKQDPNVIGGAIAGTGDNDGNNSKLILNALPSSYDFPALTSSIEKVLTDRSLKVSSITGTDDEVNQRSNVSSPKPQPVPMPFSFTISNANYAAVTELTNSLQRSIRPFHIDKIDLTGGANDMTLTINAHTYYQPSKNLKITTEVVK